MKITGLVWLAGESSDLDSQKQSQLGDCAFQLPERDKLAHLLI